MLPQTGERQVAEHIEGIKPNHRQRYGYAIMKIREQYGQSAPINVLDAACGVGYGTWMLAKAIKNCTALGVDVFPDAITAANRAYKLENNSFRVLDLGNEDDWDFEKDAFDAIVSIETIEHVSDAESLVRRYSEASPFLVGSVPNEDVVPFQAAQHPFHFRHYTKGQFEELLNDYGYHVTQWATQYDKIPGEVYEADDGMGFIVSASRA